MRHLCLPFFLPSPSPRGTAVWRIGWREKLWLQRPLLWEQREVHSRRAGRPGKHLQVMKIVGQNKWNRKKQEDFGTEIKLHRFGHSSPGPWNSRERCINLDQIITAEAVRIFWNPKYEFFGIQQGSPYSLLALLLHQGDPDVARVLQWNIHFACNTRPLKWSNLTVAL